MEIFIELKKWTNFLRKPVNCLEKWLLYLADNDPKELENVAEENRHIARAIATENVFSLDDGERYLYDMREKYFFDQGAVTNRINTLESNLKEANAQAEKAKSETKLAKAEAEKFLNMIPIIHAMMKISAHWKNNFIDFNKSIKAMPPKCRLSSDDIIYYLSNSDSEYTIFALTKDGDVCAFTEDDPDLGLDDNADDDAKEKYLESKLKSMGYTYIDEEEAYKLLSQNPNIDYEVCCYD